MRNRCFSKLQPECVLLLAMFDLQYPNGFAPLNHLCIEQCGLDQASGRSLAEVPRSPIPRKSSHREAFRSTASLAVTLSSTPGEEQQEKPRVVASEDPDRAPLQANTGNARIVKPGNTVPETRLKVAETDIIDDLGIITSHPFVNLGRLGIATVSNRSRCRGVYYYVVMSVYDLSVWIVYDPWNDDHDVYDPEDL
ncbi:MAG: hypothetical protein M1816_002874 [Peltula sp. TS41687]|nr:MAG: hypothetical protein M1816_002874 [Peltula sp. TS41687]